MTGHRGGVHAAPETLGPLSILSSYVERPATALRDIHSEHAARAGLCRDGQSCSLLSWAVVGWDSARKKVLWTRVDGLGSSGPSSRIGATSLGGWAHPPCKAGTHGDMEDVPIRWCRPAGGTEYDRCVPMYSSQSRAQRLAA